MITPCDIYGMRDFFQVHRIHAATVATEMIQFKTFTDRPNEKFIGGSVGCSRVTDEAKSSVPVLIQITGPVPARGTFEEGAALVYSVPEVGFGVFSAHTNCSPYGVVSPALGMF